MKKRKAIVYSGKFKNFSKELQDQLFKLTLHNGVMRYTATWRRSAVIYYVRYKNKVIAWSLITGDKGVMLFVKSNYRRLGIGSNLIKVMRENHGTIYGQHHNYQAHRFFTKNKVKDVW